MKYSWVHMSNETESCGGYDSSGAGDARGSECASAATTRCELSSEAEQRANLCYCPSATASRKPSLDIHPLAHAIYLLFLVL